MFDTELQLIYLIYCKIIMIGSLGFLLYRRLGAKFTDPKQIFELVIRISTSAENRTELLKRKR